MSAMTNIQSQGEAQVLSFDDKSRILELEDQLAELQEKFDKLEIQNNCRGAFIRSVAQEYFSQDPNSIYLAGISKKRPVTKEEAITHWAVNGGPEAFAAKFPTPESVMKHFRLLHAVHRKPLVLAHPVAG
jgi:hypothetical protein